MALVRCFFDIKTRDWSDEILASLDIPREWMPPTFEGPEITGLVSAEAAALTGLAQATPVMAGGGDPARLARLELGRLSQALSDLPLAPAGLSLPQHHQLWLSRKAVCMLFAMPFPVYGTSWA